MTISSFIVSPPASHDLREIAEEIRHGLASAEVFGGRAFIQTPLLLPSGSSVVISVEHQGADQFRISDLGQGNDEAEALGYARIYRRQAEELASLQGLSVTHGELWLADLGQEELVAAVMGLATAVVRATERTIMRAAERRPQTAADRLFSKLNRLFPNRKIQPEVEVRGASTHAWQIDVTMETERGLALFDIVSPAPVSVAFAAAKFHDIAALENPPTRIAVVRKKEAFGDLLAVVAQAAKVVQEDASDESFERLARAA